MNASRHCGGIAALSLLAILYFTTPVSADIIVGTEAGVSEDADINPKHDPGFASWDGGGYKSEASASAGVIHRGSFDYPDFHLSATATGDGSSLDNSTALAFAEYTTTFSGSDIATLELSLGYITFRVDGSLLGSAIATTFGNGRDSSSLEDDDPLLRNNVGHYPAEPISLFSDFRVVYPFDGQNGHPLDISKEHDYVVSIDFGVIVAAETTDVFQHSKADFQNTITILGFGLLDQNGNPLPSQDFTATSSDGLNLPIWDGPLPGSSVPEPSTFALLSLGGIGLAIGAYRRRMAAV